MMAGKLQGVGGGQRHGCVQSAGGVLLWYGAFGCHQVGVWGIGSGHLISLKGYVMI